MKILYVDAFAGISGDMTVGAFVDLGLPVEELQRQLHGVALSGYSIAATPRRVQGIGAIKFDVRIATHGHAHRAFRDIRRMLEDSALDAGVTRHAVAIFTKLAEAEGRAHRVAKDHVHFHEVGVLDSFVDIVGGLICCDLLGVTRVTSSPVNVGAGTLQSAHGILPVPGPAVAILVKGIPIYSAGPPRELTTPTGMALLRTLTSEFGPMPVMTPTAIGYGAGDADPDGWPNALRVLLARPSSRGAREQETVLQLETNLDDVNPQTYEYVIEQLFARGALDVTLAPVIMKRGRPGIVLTCLAAPAQLDQILDVLFQETTALGVRIREVMRQILPRRFVSVKVRGGIVRMKIADVNETTAKAAPEYLDCKRIAERTGRPVKRVLEDAALAYSKQREARPLGQR